jgi:predicted flap endonuclease-1-like 5' DNA nuclease
MFREWGFLLTEIWGLLVLAGLIGVIAGWIIWGRRSQVSVQGGRPDGLEVDRLRGQLADCEQRGKAQAGRLAALEQELNAADERVRRAEAASGERRAAALAAIPTLGDPALPAPATRPAALAAARGGVPDDLKQIKGIGPKLELLCHRLGFYHFDQIAGWSDAEIAWVDDNLEGFKGRVTRDDWVAQAKVLAAGGSTEFSRRVGEGGVY